MLILPKDTWDLFSLATERTSEECIARFLGHSPLIYCRLTWPDFCKRFEGTIRDRLADVAIGHETIHYLHVMSLLATQMYYWSWVFSFIQVHEIIMRREGKELWFDEETICRLGVPPSPLKKNMSLPIGKRKLNYELLLEGFAVSDFLSRDNIPSELKEAFLDEAFADEDARRINVIYVLGVSVVDDLMGYIARERGGQMLASVFRFMNYFPMFEPEYCQMLVRFFLRGDQITGEERATLCEESLKKGLRSFVALRGERQLLREVRRREEEFDELLLNLLAEKYLALRKMVDSCPRCNFVTETAASIAAILFMAYKHMISRFKLGDPEGRYRQWKALGGFSVPCVFHDGAVVDMAKKSARQQKQGGEYCTSHGVRSWLGFTGVKEIVRWVHDGGQLVCPFYRFFVTNFGEEGLKSLKTFCNRFYSETPRAREFLPCESYCTLSGPVLDIGKMSEEEGGLCVFWKSVVLSFDKFKKVRRICC